VGSRSFDIDLSLSKIGLGNLLFPHDRRLIDSLRVSIVFQSVCRMMSGGNGGDSSIPSVMNGAQDPLDQRFFYQNQQTGAVSTQSLTLRQLCRILVHGHLSHITADSQLYPLCDTTDGTSDREGWKPARLIPVLAEAVATWYFEARDEQGASNTTRGPVTSRELAIVCRGMSAEQSSSIDQLSLRVYSDTASPSWTQLRDLPNLKHALQAIEDLSAVPLSRPALIDDPVLSKSQSLDELPAQQIQDELELFLSSVASVNSALSRNERSHNSDDNDEEEEAYESDGGTRYVKDLRTGNWVHEALVTKDATLLTTSTATAASGHRVKRGSTSSAPIAQGKRNKKPKFSSKNSRCWVYITGLPPDTTFEEVAAFFGKAGILDLNPETQKPKIKLYTDAASGRCKGDASVCYARPESVGLAITLFDDAPFRPQISATDDLLHVEPAKFQAHDRDPNARAQGQGMNRASAAQRKVAKLAALQAVDWDEGEINGRITGGRKGLRIIVLKHVFDPALLPDDEDTFFSRLDQDLRARCEAYGAVEKITVFSSHPDGVVICKFAIPGAASEAIKDLNDKSWKKDGSRGPKVEAAFWDGVTDFTRHDTVKEEREGQDRHDQFGAWLESQDDLPDELKLKTE
jgi:hypothetical protein